VRLQSFNAGIGELYQAAGPLTPGQPKR